ncbi:S8 family peptidase [Pengzhenrongella frigida]|uniref:Peptidase S8/S53 subtilisin kexin sedolisin n=1 Tax=Pengzhenrongella frigida TaxID=1259133 RepID=A0A4Q5N1Z0_9MICO|nr:S8 family peptidase [Cellulomonas sp. HLT2-17]RYV52086.1 peptidase S8/S53 subtilisin kexin sedolisin [Cellulomonas sp. HLT2-17]
MVAPSDAFEEHERLQRRLDRSVIAGPLLDQVSAERGVGGAPTEPQVVAVVIDLNFDFVAGRDGAAARVRELIEQAVAEVGTAGIEQGRSPARPGGQYIVTALELAVIQRLVALDAAAATKRERAIFHVWPDFEVHALINRSNATVKADAARASFAAAGRDIVWAVLDSGVDADHIHFQEHHNLVLPAPLEHVDFTGQGVATTDPYGHGTHVAGIIAGHVRSAKADTPLNAVGRALNDHGEAGYTPLPLFELFGMAPECKLVSYKVLDNRGNGSSSAILAALDRIEQVNNYGRSLKIHGVNLSVGYEFDPEWFACGQSPLCVEVNRLVRSGVVVVVAAGNTGYAYALDRGKQQQIAAGRPLTINDPGNAELAITVGSTHRDMPHVYGVSYFSSKGPTGDGRAKPDLVAPGEKILSAATGSFRDRAASAGVEVDFIENSGTSMAAPHVSGVIAAFLSVRQEFIGRPEEIKHRFTSAATDLGRTREFQGAGLVDLMRTIQSV